MLPQPEEGCGQNRKASHRKCLGWSQKTLGTASRPPFRSARQTSWRQSLCPSSLIQSNHPPGASKVRTLPPPPGTEISYGGPLSGGKQKSCDLWQFHVSGAFRAICLALSRVISTYQGMLLYEVTKRIHHHFLDSWRKRQTVKTACNPVYCGVPVKHSDAEKQWKIW